MMTMMMMMDVQSVFINGNLMRLIILNAKSNWKISLAERMYLSSLRHI